jgi:uncharacterized membrane protein YdjX (TVP38/TMEM64 family)
MAGTGPGAENGTTPREPEVPQVVPARRKHYWRRAGQVAVALLVLGLLWWLWRAWDHQALVYRLRHAPPLPFFLAMALLPAVGMPISPLFILAGASFGTALGALGSALALAANLSVCYGLARLLRRPVQRLQKRFGGELPQLARARQSPLRFTAAVRLTPAVPQALKSYGLGAAGVPFGPFLAASMAVTGTYAVLLIVLGESMLEHNLTRTLLVVAGLVVVAVAFALWRRRRSREPAGPPAEATA